MKRVFLDACAVIYLVEDKVRGPVVRQHMAGADVYVSELSRIECLVVPLRMADKVTLDAYDLFFSAPPIHVVPVTSDIIMSAATIRAQFKSVRTPDAINVATAVKSSVDYMLTNDKNLKKLTKVVKVRTVDP